jgi:glycosyltransferase involved in cell wall biosynthesis
MKKVITFVSNNCWSIYNFRADVIKKLLQDGYQVAFIAPRDEYASMLISLGCTYYPVQFSNKSLNPLADIRFYFQLKRLYRQIKPQLVFHYVAKPNIYGSLAASSLGIRSVAIVTGLGYAFHRRNWLYRLVKFMYRHALKRAEEVWFLNNEDAGAFRKEKIVRIAKVKVLPGEGVNTGYFSPQFDGIKQPNEKFTFLMSTRMLKSKGISVYADAARILRKKDYDVQFDLLGFFEKEHPDSVTEEEIRKWEEEGLLHYKGFVKDVRPFLKQADCFVFPSFYNEGVPRSLMEAASMELPIITCVNRGCKEVVLNNSTGFLCNPNDPFDLAEKMERMIKLAPEFRDRMGKHGRLLVIKKFNVKNVVKEYERKLAGI